jgi:hypothetical protein
MPRNFTAQITAAIAALISSTLFVGASIVPATQNAASLII